MFQNAFLRPAIGLPFAGLIVFGLFSFMQNMVSVDFVPPEPSPQRILEAFVPASPDDKPSPPDRRPEKLNLADQPPPPPKQSAVKGDIDLPVPVIRGAAPQDVGRIAFDSLLIDAVVIDDREALPLSPPVPAYPSTLAVRNIEGDCAVQFDVDTRGRPYNIKASCTHSGFVREAEKAVSRVMFAPKVERGRPVERSNVVYPIEFRLN